MRTLTSIRDLLLRVSRPLLAAGVAAVGLLTAFGPGCSTGDQACTPESDVTDVDDRCPYGEPGGPKLKIESCKNPTAAEAPITCPTWEEVYPAIIEGCTTNSCHGMSPVGGIQIRPDPVQSYTDIISFAPSRGVYLKPQSEGDGPWQQSWFLCNLRGEREGGSPMPPPNGLTNPADILMIEGWYACGAKGPGSGGTTTSTTTGGGGAGGGGAGGAGGAGGI